MKEKLSELNPQEKIDIDQLAGIKVEGDDPDDNGVACLTQACVSKIENAKPLCTDAVCKMGATA